MNVFYRMIIDYIDVSPIEEPPLNLDGFEEPEIDEFDDQEEIEDDIESWSISNILDENNNVKTIRNYIGKKDDKFFNSIIRNTVEDYKHNSRFDHFKWIIEEFNNNRVILLISYCDESMLLDDFLNNLKKLFGYSSVKVKNINVKDIELKDYFNSHSESMKKGFLECSTAWDNEAGRFDYIHELYEDED